MTVARRGDVAIFRTHHTWSDNLISLGEHGSPFTHASIVIDNKGTVVEATTARGIALGVLPTDTGEYITLSPKALGASDDRITYAIQWAISLGEKGVHYGYSDIAYQVTKYLVKFIGIRRPLWHKDDEPDCSDFCAQYLLTAGAKLPWTFDTCYQVTPADLARLAQGSE